MIDDAAHVHAPDRLAAVRGLALLDTPSEESFDRLARLATKLLHVPVALITLVEQDRQYFKSCVGLAEPWASQRETSLTHSFCQHVVASRNPLVIEDARQHPLVRSNLAIRDLGVVAYAGIPLVTRDGHAVGAFCAIDTQPRSWEQDEVQILQDLAASVTTEIELRSVAAEAERRRKEWQALLDSSLEGVFGMDMQARCTYINRAAQNLLGYTAEECLGRNMHELTHYKRPDGSPYPLEECPIYHAFRSGRGARLIEEILWRKDGTPVPALSSCSPIIEDGIVVGSIVTIVDITEQKRARQQREELLAQVEHALELRNQFLSIASHELKTPVTSLKGYAQLLHQRARRKGYDDMLKPLHVIDRQVDRITALIEDLLEVSRIESGRLEFEMLPFDLNSMVEEVVSEMGTATPEFTLRLSKPDGEIRVRGDEMRIEQLITNLLNNAVKYSDKRKEVDIAIKRDGGEAVVSVTDYGIGIPARQQSEVFELYFRGTNVPAEHYGGLGLGLYISKAIIERHGGTIGVTSEEGKGSTFFFSLPIV